MSIAKGIRSVPTQELISHLVLREHDQLPVIPQRNLIAHATRQQWATEKTPAKRSASRNPVQRSQLQLQSVSFSS
jgi:hypothetical protein